MLTLTRIKTMRETEPNLVSLALVRLPSLPIAPSLRSVFAVLALIALAACLARSPLAFLQLERVSSSALSALELSADIE